MMRNRPRLLGGALLALAILALAPPAATVLMQAPGLQSPAAAQEQGLVPGNAHGSDSRADVWRAIREGGRGTVSIPDKQAGVLVQSEGDNWRAARNGPISVYGVWAMIGIVALLALFFALRGRIRIEEGPSGIEIERFSGLERFAHWLTAGSFLILALTGLNLLYGRYVLKPVLGAEIFAAITRAGKYAHDYLAFAFMAGLLLIFVLWIRDNLPNRYDLIWLAKGGGFFSKGSHPPAKRFNAGQKLVFWAVVLGGLSLSLSGLALLFPFRFAMFSNTFAAINLLGFDLPTNLTPLQEMQLSQLWHAVVALLMVVVIIGHIYIGTLGMEGAFDAMGTGKVDRNWAREHHSLWLRKVEEAPTESGAD